MEAAKRGSRSSTKRELVREPATRRRGASAKAARPVFVPATYRDRTGLRFEVDADDLEKTEQAWFHGLFEIDVGRGLRKLRIIPSDLVKLTLSAIAVAVLLTACTSDGPFVGRVSRSEFFEYHDKATTPLCNTLLPLLDEHARSIGRLIGYEPSSSDSPIRYYKFSSPADFADGQDACEANLAGCASGSSVYSWQPLHAHELVHSYAFRAWGGASVGLLNEGEATALSCSPPNAETLWFGPAPDWRDFLGRLSDPTRYVFAARFITYLASSFGWQKVGALHRRVPPGSAALDFEREFARVFPMSMDAAWSAAKDSSTTGCFPDWVCMGKLLMEGETAEPDCDGEMHRSIQLQSQPGIVLSFAGAGLTLTNCAEPAPTRFLDGSAKANQRSIHWASLPPGNYAITHLTFPAPIAVTLERYLSRPLLGETCDVAGTVQLDAAAQTFIELPPQLSSGWVHLRGGERSYLVDSPVLTTSGAALEVCETCGSTETCKAISSEPGTPFVISDRAALHLRDISDTRWTQLRFVPADL